MDKQNPGTCFDFQKRAGEASPSLSCTPDINAE